MDQSPVVPHIIVYVWLGIYISLVRISTFPFLVISDRLSFVTQEVDLAAGNSNQGNDRRALSDIIGFYFPSPHVSQRICTFFPPASPTQFPVHDRTFQYCKQGRMPVEILACQISHSVPRRTRYSCTRSISHDRLFACPLGLSFDGYWRVGARM